MLCHTMLYVLEETDPQKRDRGCPSLPLAPCQFSSRLCSLMTSIFASPASRLLSISLMIYLAPAAPRIFPPLPYPVASVPHLCLLPLSLAYLLMHCLCCNYLLQKLTFVSVHTTHNRSGLDVNPVCRSVVTMRGRRQEITGKISEVDKSRRPLSGTLRGYGGVPAHGEVCYLLTAAAVLHLFSAVCCLLSASTVCCL
jgi:hypothetical protein